MPLILISILVALISGYGSSVNIIEPLTFLKIDLGSFQNGYANFYSLDTTYYLYNEWWVRDAIMCIHFSLTHLVFNCLWIYVLGSKIELYDGHFTLLNLVIFSSIRSNVA